MNIKCMSVTKHYGKLTALRDFSFTFQSGGTYGILGINGAGKSTLIGCLTGNLKYEGEIVIDGAGRHGIGYVPQSLALYPELSVMENLLFFARIHRIPKKSAVERATSLMARTGLTEKADTAVRDLSGGMQRKLNLITALVHNPEVLICDEVCIGIDPPSRKEILTYLKQLADEGMTILYTSHYLDEVAFLCDDIVFLHEGRIVKQGPTRTLTASVEKGEGDLADVFEQVLREEEA
ncbi:MAG: ABC transporter ATP-binding protein [Eubacteriales bacterium]|nr:ABC transporter ATP-binding protein [Eubacteriales bacterium]